MSNSNYKKKTNQKADNLLKHDLLEIFSKYNDVDELLIFIYDNDTDDMILNDLLTLSVFKKEFYENFYHVLNHALENDLLIILTLRSPKNKKLEVRSLKIQNNSIIKLSSNELRECYSTDSRTGRPINPPNEYIFCKF